MCLCVFICVFYIYIYICYQVIINAKVCTLKTGKIVNFVNICPTAELGLNKLSLPPPSLSLFLPNMYIKNELPIHLLLTIIFSLSLFLSLSLVFCTPLHVLVQPGQWVGVGDWRWVVRNASDSHRVGEIWDGEPPLLVHAYTVILRQYTQMVLYGTCDSPAARNAWNKPSGCVTVVTASPRTLADIGPSAYVINETNKAVCTHGNSLNLIGRE